MRDPIEPREVLPPQLWQGRGTPGPEQLRRSQTGGHGGMWTRDTPPGGPSAWPEDTTAARHQDEQRWLLRPGLARVLHIDTPSQADAAAQRYPGPGGTIAWDKVAGDYDCVRTGGVALSHRALHGFGAHTTLWLNWAFEPGAMRLTDHDAFTADVPAVGAVAPERAQAAPEARLPRARPRPAAPPDTDTGETPPRRAKGVPPLRAGQPVYRGFRPPHTDDSASDRDARPASDRQDRSSRDPAPRQSAAAPAAADDTDEHDEPADSGPGIPGLGALRGAGAKAARGATKKAATAAAQNVTRLAGKALMVKGAPVIAIVAAVAMALFLLFALVGGSVVTDPNSNCQTSQPGQLATVAGGNVNGAGDIGPIPPNMVGVYQAAGQRYGVDWRILAAIGWVETNHGANLNVSSAGAQGWMQFMKETWAAYGVDANGDGKADAWQMEDAIHGAANYIAAMLRTYNGSLREAIRLYNGPDWYMQRVLDAARAYGFDGGWNTVLPIPDERPSRTNRLVAMRTGAPTFVTPSSGVSRMIAGDSDIVPVPGFPGEEAARSVLPLIAAVVARWPSLVVTDAFDRDRSANHSSAGHNVTGTAVDFDGPDADMDAAVAWLVSLGFTVGYDGRFGSQDWPDHGPSTRTSNHHFHVEGDSAPMSVLANGAPIAQTASVQQACAELGGGVGDGTIAALIAAADELDAMNVPYRFGGGHVQPATPNPGLDCSSSVSWVLQRAGFDVPTMNTSGFIQWPRGEGADGVTLWVDDTVSPHVFLQIGDRYFGTGGGAAGNRGENGGPAWFARKPDAAYMSRFTPVHIPPEIARTATPARSQGDYQAATSGLPAGASVAVVGDSLAEGTRTALGDMLQGARLTTDAHTGRRLAEGMQRIRSLRPAPDVLVVSLGTNDDDDPNAITRAVRESTRHVRPGGCVVWATIWRAGRPYPKTNQALMGMIGGQVRVVDWAAQVTAHPSWVRAGDGTHATADGYRQRARLYAAQIATCGVV